MVKARSAHASLAALLALAAACGDQTLVLIRPVPGGGTDAAASEDAAPLTPTLSVSVSWNQPTGRTASPLHYGLTSVRAADPALSGKPGEPLFLQNLAQMRPGLLRLAHPDLLDDSTARASGWIIGADTTTPRWDRAKIARVMDGLAPVGAELMITLGSWPRGFGDPAMALPAARHAGFAALCADLVRALNVEQRRGVRYFEILSEKEEGAYAGRGDELGQLVAQAAAAMKAIDRNVKVGGAGFVQVFAPELAQFLEAAAGGIDFVSYHGYGTGNPQEDLARVFAMARQQGEQVEVVAQHLAALQQPQIEILQTQWSLNWMVDPRMIDARGAVFDALSLAAFAASAVTGGTGWNDSDGWYGKLDSTFRARPAAAVLRLFNQHMTGPVVTSGSDDDTRVFAFAIAQTGRRALVLVNQTDAPIVVGLRHTTGAPFGTGLRRTVVAGNTAHNTVDEAAVDAPAERTWRTANPAGVLPAMSVTFLHEP